MARPFLTHEEFVNRLKLDGRGYSIRAGFKYEDSRKKIPLVCPNHPEHDWWVLPNNIAQGGGCKLCRDEKQSKTKSLSHEQFISMLSKDPRGIKVRESYKYTRNKDNLHLVCPHHPEYDWFTRPLGVLYNQDKKCPMCVGQAPITHERLQRELEGRPIEVLSDTRREDGKMHFRCTVDGYDWWAKPTKVASEGHGCPKCGNRVPWTNERVDSWLVENAPTISRLTEVNGKHSRVKFKCSVDNYEWESQVNNVLHGGKCPLCSGFGHWNDLLIDAWLKENDKPFVRVGSYKTGQRTKFKCLTCNHKWLGRIGYLRKGYGCPECTKGGGFDVNRAGNLYYGKVVVNGETYFKVGVTNRKSKTRLRETSNESEVIYEFYFSEGLAALEKEKEVLRLFKQHLTHKRFNGSTECFTIDIRSLLDLESFITNKEL